ncbi:hypothetical protein GPJ56_010084 [Histomonas meleagridis]|uniref:uncharacterized protein n=1 Tax=Histomonas meleagridis TaxID=135588 RepID=UPI00355944BB|nr:hypothetical protein GPJ56_010084 [Histomonas meleagridis]KAH0806740.1 hypothetical protein GO595_000383 [Histomonas meleagridis]
MEVDRKILSQVKKIVDLHSGHVIACMRTQNVLRRSAIEPAVLVITEIEFVLLTESTGKLAVVDRFTWPMITHVNLLSKIQVQLNKSSGGLVLQQDNAYELASYVIGYLSCILPPNEVPKFEGDRSFLTQFTPLKVPQYQRFLYLATKAKIQLGDTFLKAIKEQMKNIKFCDFTKIPKSDICSDIIIDSLTIQPAIKGFSIQKSKKGTLWTQIAKMISSGSNPNLEVIKIHEPIDSSFTELIKAFQSTNTKIHTFKFFDSNFQKNQVQLLIDFVTASKVNYLSLSKACDNDFISKFICMSTQNDSLKSTRVLKLEGIPNLNISELLNNIPTIKSLKISSCEIDVSSALCSLSATSLHSFTISHSTASNRIDKTSQLPPSLDTINLHHIQWEGTTYADAWVLLMRHKPASNQLKIDMSAAVVPDNVWQGFFNGIRNLVNPRLVNLKYCSNPIRPQLIEFIGKLPNLKALCFQGCLRNETPELVKSFGEMLASNSTIKSLDVSGNAFGKMRESSLEIIKALRTNTGLEKVNFSNNEFGDKCLKELQQTLIENKRIRKLFWDGNNIRSPEVLARFIETMGGRGSQLVFNWPEKELHEMMKKRMIKSAHVENLHKIFQKVVSLKNVDQAEDDDKFQQELLMYSTNRMAGNLTELEIGEWSSPFPTLQKPDNNEIIKDNAERFSLSNIVGMFYKTLSN